LAQQTVHTIQRLSPVWGGDGGEGKCECVCVCVVLCVCEQQTVHPTQRLSHKTYPHSPTHASVLCLTHTHIHTNTHISPPPSTLPSPCKRTLVCTGLRSGIAC
jgi:hypothetical protein